LNDLLAAGDIPVHKADKAKAQYATLHGELVRALANERDLLDKARALKKQKEASGVAVVLLFRRGTCVRGTCSRAWALTCAPVRRAGEVLLQGRAMGVGG
jgi:hypothetical protein